MHLYLEAIMASRFLIYTYVVLIPAVGIYGLIQYKKLSGYNKLVVQLTLISALVQDYIYLPFDWVETNLPLFHVFATINIVYIGLIFRKLFPYKTRTGRVIFYVAIVLAAISAVYTVFVQGFHSDPAFNIMLLACFAVVSSLIYFQYLLNSPSEGNILDFPPFWFVTGTLVFFAISFCYLTFESYYEAMEKDLVNAFENYFLSVAIIILYLSYLMCIVKDININNSIKSRDV